MTALPAALVPVPPADAAAETAADAAPGPMPDPAALIACPKCDALYRVHAPRPGERAVCARCHTVLITPRDGAVLRIVALALAVLVLLGGAVFLPFLEIRTLGLHNASSVFDAALAFEGPALATLSVAVLMMIVGIPLLRVLLTLWVLLPVLIDRPLLPGAARAFRLSEELRPWSMAEIFVIGVGVALVKIADLARIEFGPAFFMFALFVAVSVLQDGYMCRWSVWQALDRQSRR
jgi:paraquat-inducible protein A